MQAESVGYTYRVDELAVLMCLCGYKNIPCLEKLHIPDVNGFALAMEELEKAGIIERTEKAIFVDRIQRFLVMKLCGCGSFSVRKSRVGETVLCDCGDILITVRLSRNGEVVVLYPEKSECLEK